MAHRKKLLILLSASLFCKAIFSREAIFRSRAGKCVHRVIQTKSAVDLLDCLATCLKWSTCRAVTYNPTDQECLLSDSFYMNDTCLIQEPKTYVRDFPCEEGWYYNEVSNSCVLLAKTSKLSADAVNNCHNLGADFIEIRSEEAQNWTHAFFDYTGMSDWNFHLGLMKNGTEWRWMSNGEPLSFDYWADGEPNGDGGCVDLKASLNHMWSDVECNEPWRKSLCERRL